MGNRTDVQDRNIEIVGKYRGGVGLLKLSKDFDIPRPYLRAILKAHGLKLVRAERYERGGDRQKLDVRNARIIDLYKDGKLAADIAAAVGLTKTRVLQILKGADAYENKTDRIVELNVIVDRIRADIAANVPYESRSFRYTECANRKCRQHGRMYSPGRHKCAGCSDRLVKRDRSVKGILHKYGKKTILDIKKVTGVAVFSEARDFRFAGILKDYNGRSMKPLEIAMKYHCTRDYVYYIIHGHHISEETRIAGILADYDAGMKQAEIAIKYCCTRDYVNSVIRKDK